MNSQLCNHDVFPKVFPEGRRVTITIRPIGYNNALKPGGQYAVRIEPCGQGFPGVPQYEWRKQDAVRGLVAEKDGSLCFTAVFHGEQPQIIRVYEADKVDELKWGEHCDFLFEVTVYSLFKDLCGLYPFRGDLHMHTTRSDGCQCPAIVAAAYRQAGLDFTVISDHHRYYPSLEAIRSYMHVPIEFTIIPGEEVHMEGNDVHIVNFGSTYSVNALIRGRPHNRERGKTVSERAIIKNPPPVIDEEEFKRQVEKLIPSLHIPDGIEKFQYAACVWVFRQIRKGGGVGIFAHPYWTSSTWQIPEEFTRYMLEQHPFDAFEVLGGAPATQQNRLQTALYHEMQAKGIDFPIVGSTDSHSCYNNPAGAHICSTLVFAKENTREELVRAILAKRTVAIDTSGTPAHLVGSFRLQKYTDFLLDHFFPLHDELCFEEGRLMKDHVMGDKRAHKTIRCISGRMREQREKYFQFSRSR